MANTPPPSKRSSSSGPQNLPPIPHHSETLLSPYQMASKLRFRLRRARMSIERDLGHSLTTISPARSRRSLAATRAHSYSQGDFPSSANRPVGPSRRARAAALLRHQSAAPSVAAASSAPRAPLELLPSSPPVLPRTPLLQPQDSEKEIAHTILMLATPPAPRPSSLSESPCQRSSCSRIQDPHARRRLSFSRCAGNGYSRIREQTAVSSFDTPNLSQIAALSQPPGASSRNKRPVPGSSSSAAAAANDTARLQPPR
ncbi:hypothetical protein LPJ78_003604 [Coemansia sp. RSA 989]|nr:hypothetical protein BX667DRAFT_508160 [Coemansia mojavensis]KAJ1741592.1 hypothetical protein LPJ68_002721 [Coemansia sp. RSA 1086]KAJ1864135.1 hypothetical protein LPJ78_003604 [Coemansia sp. RSA 989]KAJ1871773.1 hypothetical protein LPJ55_003605 [Coemansia sp. RSA 990]KAJ2668858.1 hypothetical protein IWW42_004916 [Coemansia sp. RSA 1085]